MEKELVLLGLLKEGPRHGYELKRVVDEKISTFAPLSSGSIYYTLKGLEKNSLVSMARKKKGRYPEKEVYRITKKGEEKFRELLKETCFNIKRLYRSMDIVLYLMNYLKPGEVIEGLRNRIGQITEIREETKGIYTKVKKKKYPYYIQAIAQRNIRFMDEEIEWMEDFIQTIKKKKSDAFGWSIYNDHADEESFSSEVSVTEIGTGCTMTKTQAENLISLGKSQSNIRVASASRLTHPKKIIFNIPDTAKACQITYTLDVTDKEWIIYDSVDLLLTIK